MKSLLDPTFRYVPSSQTDIRKTFARIRREARTQQREALLEGRMTKVTPLFTERKFAR
jgi:hypothetical protein